ncbi:DUF4199 domain-containing protein [Lishizhenia tianjinensis]|nr:DUF4199 domain-containing protein [Lishizhenia tianjinensis]
MKTWNLEMKWGVIFTLVALLWMVMEKALGWHDEHLDKHMWLTNLFAIPAILVFVLAMKEKRMKAYNGSVNFKQAFLTAVKISVVVAILSPFSQYLTSVYITPDYFKNVIPLSVEMGYYNTIEEAEAYFNLENYMVQSVVGALIMGVVTGAIIATIQHFKYAKRQQDKGMIDAQ